MSDPSRGSRAEQLDRALNALLSATPEIEAAAVVSFDGLPMAAALPEGMDEDRVAAMSAALLSLGERAAAGLGRGELSQVYIEGDTGTVFLVSADNEAVLVAVAARGAKAGLMLYEVRRAAAAVADVLRDPPVAQPADLPAHSTTAAGVLPPDRALGPRSEPAAVAVPAQPVRAAEPAQPVGAAQPAQPLQPVGAAELLSGPSYVSPLDPTWSPSYAPTGHTLDGFPAAGAPGAPSAWS